MNEKPSNSQIIKWFTEMLPEHIEVDPFNYDYESDSQEEKSIKNNELCRMQWYPDNPVGFFDIAAPTLNDLMSYSIKLK